MGDFKVGDYVWALYEGGKTKAPAKIVGKVVGHTDDLTKYSLVNSGTKADGFSSLEKGQGFLGPATPKWPASEMEKMSPEDTKLYTAKDEAWVAHVKFIKDRTNNDKKKAWEDAIKKVKEIEEDRAGASDPTLPGGRRRKTRARKSRSKKTRTRRRR